MRRVTQSSGAEKSSRDRLRGSLFDAVRGAICCRSAEYGLACCAEFRRLTRPRLTKKVRPARTRVVTHGFDRKN